MINNFWLDRRRDRQLAIHAADIAARNGLGSREFERLPREQKVKLLEQHLSRLAKPKVHAIKGSDE